MIVSIWCCKPQMKTRKRNNNNNNSVRISKLKSIFIKKRTVTITHLYRNLLFQLSTTSQFLDIYGIFADKLHKWKQRRWMTRFNDASNVCWTMRCKRLLAGVARKLCWNPVARILTEFFFYFILVNSNWSLCEIAFDVNEYSLS